MSIMNTVEVLVGIGEVARMLDVASHTVRYWEKEFDFFVQPPRTVGRQRRYDSLSIERLQEIKRLLKDEGYSIAGAKRVLLNQKPEESNATGSIEPFESTQDMLNRITKLIRKELIQELSIGQVNPS